MTQRAIRGSGGRQVFVNDTELFLLDPSRSPLSRIVSHAPVPMRIYFGDTPQWQRPWTFVDYAFWGSAALMALGLGLVFWNPIGKYGRHTRSR